MEPVIQTQNFNLYTWVVLSVSTASGVLGKDADCSGPLQTYGIRLSRSGLQESYFN